MVDPKIPGREIKLGDETVIVAPVLLADFFELESDMDRMNPRAENYATKSSERFRIMARVVAASLKRNHEGFTEESVIKRFDMGNIEKAFNAALAVSGLE